MVVNWELVSLFVVGWVLGFVAGRGAGISVGLRLQFAPRQASAAVPGKEIFDLEAIRALTSTPPSRG